MKIFVSYSRSDGSDIAEQIQNHFSRFKHDIFIDINKIPIGDVWGNTIEENISNCDIFVLIVTHGALQSPHVNNEVLKAQQEGKKIIPCIHKRVSENDIKWGLEKIQGVKFDDKFQLARDLYANIEHRNIPPIIPGINRVKVTISILIVVSALGIILFFSLDIFQNPSTTNSEEMNKEQYLFTNIWGSPGNETGKFSYPRGIAVDSSGNVYVADTRNDRIQKFTSNGSFITTWGSKGNNNGSFDSPIDLAIDISDNVYVSDSNNHRIQKFDSEGRFLLKWGSKGTALGEFSNPRGIAIDKSGNLYVADSANNRIQKFTSNGTPISIYKGNPAKEFSFPRDVAIDSLGNIYVADSRNEIIQKLTPDGTFIEIWSSFENGTKRFNYPIGIALDNSSNIYIVDSEDSRIQKLTSTDGTLITEWGSQGRNAGEFNDPEYVIVNSLGYVYISDTLNHRIQVFTLKSP